MMSCILPFAFFIYSLTCLSLFLMNIAITSPDAPAAVGPYSQAIAAGPWLFTAGQIPLDPQTGILVDGDITRQTEQVLKNLKAVLAARGLSFSNVVKATVFMVDLAQFAEMNAVYATYFSEPYPARSTIQVSALPKGALVEIELVAFQG